MLHTLSCYVRMSLSLLTYNAPYIFSYIFSYTTEKYISLLTYNAPYIACYTSLSYLTMLHTFFLLTTLLLHTDWNSQRRGSLRRESWQPETRPHPPPLLLTRQRRRERMCCWLSHTPSPTEDLTLTTSLRSEDTISSIVCSYGILYRY